MKYTIDRLNALREHYGLLPHLVPSDLWGECRSHCYLDVLDRCADIDTLWSDGHKCSGEWTCASDHRQPNYVGARLALHEQHLGWTAFGCSHIAPHTIRNGTVRCGVCADYVKPYFWLGAEAEWCNAA